MTNTLSLGPLLLLNSMLRTPSEHMKLIHKSKRSKKQHDAKRSNKRYQGVKGVLGSGKVYELLSNLPLTTLFDKMH